SDDVGVTKVEFWCDDSVLLGTATTAPYSIACNTTTMSAGSHAFTCKAYDSAGHSTTSAANTATVSNLTTTLGQLQWVKAMVPPPSSGNAFPQGVAADHSGNVVVVGWFKGTVDFGTGPISSSATGDSDAFVAKYNAQGGALWVKRFGSTLPDEATGVAIDSQDNIIVTGFFASTVDFGGTTLTATPPSDPLMTPNADIFVVKYSASGNLAWAKRFGGQLTDRGAAVAADANGNVLVVATLGSINAEFGRIT